MKVIEYDDHITERVLDGTYNQGTWTKWDSIYLLAKIICFLISARWLYNDWSSKAASVGEVFIDFVLVALCILWIGWGRNKE